MSLTPRRRLFASCRRALEGSPVDADRFTKYFGGCESLPTRAAPGAPLVAPLVAAREAVGPPTRPAQDEVQMLTEALTQATESAEDQMGEGWGTLAAFERQVPPLRDSFPGLGSRACVSKPGSTDRRQGCRRQPPVGLPPAGATDVRSRRKGVPRRLVIQSIITNHCNILFGHRPRLSVFACLVGRGRVRNIPRRRASRPTSSSASPRLA